MSKEPTRTDFPAGNFISENAVRAVFGGRPRRSPTAPTHTGDAVVAHPLEGSSGAGSGTRRLRRWSVAELIARAVPSPPSTT